MNQEDIRYNIKKDEQDNAITRYDHQERKAALAERFKHINGWGIDADPQNEPTYPMKHYTGVDHLRSHYQRPALQVADVEVLHSNERPGLSAVYGNTLPPSRWSGWLRRFAFRFSEESLKHWFALVLADRINMVEGIADDLRNKKIPNVFAEMGWGADLKYNKKAFAKRLALTAMVSATIVYLVKRRK